MDYTILLGEPLSESEFPQLPSHLIEHRRDTLLIHPEVHLQF